MRLRHNLEELGVDGRIISVWALKNRLRERGLDLCGYIYSISLLSKASLAIDIK